MAEGRSRALWDHTSVIVALLRNIHRDPKKADEIQAADVHPYRKKKKAEPPKVKMADLRGLLMGGLK